MFHKNYFVYILTNPNHTVLYVGITNNLERRIHEHKEKLVKGFTEKYNVNQLMYYELYHNSIEAILREKQLKAGSRKKKIALIESVNPLFEDLYGSLL